MRTLLETPIGDGTEARVRCKGNRGLMAARFPEILRRAFSRRRERAKNHTLAGRRR